MSARGYKYRVVGRERGKVTVIYIAEVTMISVPTVERAEGVV